MHCIKISFTIKHEWKEESHHGYTANINISKGRTLQQTTDGNRLVTEIAWHLKGLSVSIHHLNANTKRLSCEPSVNAHEVGTNGHRACHSNDRSTRSKLLSSTHLSLSTSLSLSLAGEWQTWEMLRVKCMCGRLCGDFIRSCVDKRRQNFKVRRT